MELELGLKITKTKDDIASTSEYQLAKDKGPVFQSRETTTMFILTAHLKGYKRNKIDIKISKDGSKISISGEKPIQEMVMMGWVMHRKVVDVTGFNKVFKIPDGVNLDKIKAKYDEEEWILSVVMPKLVKGICGHRIEEVKEEEFDKRRSELLEKSATDHVSSSVGETSQKGYKESQVQDMEGSESIMEKKEGDIADKMVDDANKEMNEERIKKEVGESNLGIDDGNGEGVRKKVGKEEYEVMKTSEIEQNVGVCISKKIEDTSQDKESEVQKMDSGSVEKKKGGESDKMIDDGNGDQTGSTFKKGKEESKLRIEEGKVKGTREKVGKETYEAMKTSEIEQDISQDKEFEDQEMEEKGSVVEKEKMVSNNMVDDANEDITGEMIQEEIEKSKLAIEEGDGESVKEGCEAVKSSEIEKNVGAQIIGVTSQGVSEESLIQQSGESKQKEFGESKCETEDRLQENMKESSMEPFEAMKVSELDQIPSNIGDISQKEFEESRIQQMEKTKSTEGKIDGGESEKATVEANKDVENTIFGDIIQKDITKPKIETENEDQECIREKPDKEGSDATMTIRKEFPKKLPKTTLEESEGLNVQKMQEIKDVKEERIKKKGNGIEYFVEKGESERHKTMHVEAKKGITRETMQEETEKKKNGIDESGQQHVGEKTVKEKFEVPKSITEELPKQLEELDGSKGFKVAKEEEKKEVTKEAMAETEILMKKVEGEESKKRNEEASRAIEKSTVTETLMKKTEESNIEKKSSDVGELQVLGTFQEKLPKKVVKEVAQDEKDKTEYGIVKLKGKGSIKMHVEPKEAFEEDTTGDRIEREIRKQKLESSDQLSGKENVDNGIFGERKRQKFPEMEEAEDVKEEGAENEQSVKKMNGDKDEKMQVEVDEDFKKEITKETTGKEIEDPKIPKKEKDKHHLHEEMSKGRSKARKPAKEEFPMKMLGSPANTREGPKDTKMEKTEGIKGEMSKERSKARKAAKEDFPLQMLDSPDDTREGLKDTKMEKTEGINEEDAETENFVNKVKGEKYEKIQVQAHGGLRNDTTKETAKKEKEEPKILINVKDQQCLQEEMSKGRCEASTTAREFPMQIVDSLAKTREGPKGKEMEEAEEAKRKSEETKVVESATKEKTQGPESERTTQILHEAPEEKHPKALEIGNPERELQSEKGAKVVNMGFEEVEQESAKDKKQKTKVLPPKIQCKETHESKDESMNQNILKPEKTKEVGEQCIYNTASTEEVATIEDQVVKPLSAPRFPSTQQSEQSEVEEKDKKYEGGKAKYEASLESQKGDPTKDIQNLIETKNQEDKQKETLKPEIPLEKGGQVIRRGEFHKGQNVGETMQEKIEGPKSKIDDRDQQYVARDVGKVDTTEEEMSKEYVADAGSKVERMVTKRGLKTTLEREEYITTQNVNDEKPKIQDEIIKADVEKVNKAKCTLESMKTTQEKEHPIKSEEAVEKETESLEPISSLPSVTSKGVKEVSPKNEIVEPQQKELSHLTAEMKSKEPLELDKPVMQWKFPKTKEHVPLTELRDKEQDDHGTEEIKTPKIAAYEGARPSKLQKPTITQQSTDEENRKSENVVEEHEATKESPKINIVETDQIDSLQPQVLENQCFEEQKADEQEEALDQCEFQGPKILIEDRGQQYVQENNDEKGYQTPKAVEEEIVLKKREGSKVAKSEEAKDSSRHKIEKGKTTQTAEEKKPTMIEKTPQFEKERVHQIESEEGTSKIGVIEPPTMIEKTPNKEVERKEPHELTWPTMDHEFPKIEEEVQQEKKRERHIDALEATISKEEGLAQATATHSKTISNVEPKNEIDKPQVNQLPSPSIEMSRKKPHELGEFNMKEDDSNGKSLVQVREKKEPIHSIEGTTSSEVAADKVSQHSKLSSSSCTQQFEVEGEDETDSKQNQESQEAKKDSKIDDQESTKSETGQQVEQIESLQPESLADQQCMNKDKEEKHGREEIEEEKTYEEVLEEQKECKEEASGGKKEDAKMSKKLFVPLVIAGSALLVSLVVIFVRHRRARKR